MERMKQEDERQRRKRERRRKKQERRWSPQSLAVKGTEETEEAGPAPKEVSGKKRKKILPKHARKSLAFLLKRLYGYVLHPSNRSPGSLMKEFNNDTGRALISREENKELEKKEITMQLIPHRTTERRNPLLILLEKMYGYVIMSTMMSFSNKLGWKPREAIEVQTRKTEGHGESEESIQ